MIQIEDKIVSQDVFDVLFACDYAACKGACCVEGDSGAPLEPGEAELLRRYLPLVEHLLSPQARAIIAEQGVSYLDEDGDEVTSIVEGKDCVFTTYDEHGNCQCAFEKVYNEGKSDFIKPLSCQLSRLHRSELPQVVSLQVRSQAWSSAPAPRLSVPQGTSNPSLRRGVVHPARGGRSTPARGG